MGRLDPLKNAFLPAVPHRATVGFHGLCVALVLSFSRMFRTTKPTAGHDHPVGWMCLQAQLGGTYVQYSSKLQRL